ncbi:DUF2693 domain-containing protein [bacterium]|nr:DUF2693 domain-containing protein [bacterium]
MTNVFEDTVSRDWLQGLLKNEIVKVTFTKKDGTDRTMLCTLKEDLILPYETKTDRVKKASEDTIAVYDLEKESWRSFRFDSIKQVDFGNLEVA